jgi:hypothetical protein
MCIQARFIRAFSMPWGAMHLMGNVLDNLRLKGVEISAEEYEASQISILLHDIGHVTIFPYARACVCSRV